jgi:hypothetical protein
MEKRQESPDPPRRLPSPAENCTARIDILPHSHHHGAILTPLISSPNNWKIPNIRQEGKTYRSIPLVPHPRQSISTSPLPLVSVTTGRGVLKRTPGPAASAGRMLRADCSAEWPQTLAISSFFPPRFFGSALREFLHPRPHAHQRPQRRKCNIATHIEEGRHTLSNRPPTTLSYRFSRIR